MQRAGLLVLPFLIAIPALIAAEPPSIPKDTLPEKLQLDAVPLGLAERSIPKDNLLTVQRVNLGRKLFFDPILSKDRTIACASCHQPDRGFAGAGARSRGVDGQEGDRRAP